MFAEESPAAAAGPALLLVHGAAADHTTWRVVGPRLARRFPVWKIDRRGRGASGDGPRYSIEREFEDVAVVAETLAAESGADVVVVGHSFGGRIGLGAALRTGRIGRLVVYEGAPAGRSRPYQPPGLVDRLAALRDAGRDEELLMTFLREVVGMHAASVMEYRSNPVWPARVAAAHTIVRELEAEASPAAGLDALSAVRVPVLQLLGSASVPAFHEATAALAARLRDGRVVAIDGARHAAHHTHPDRFVAEVASFAGS